MKHDASAGLLIAVLASGLLAQAQTASPPGAPPALPATVAAAGICGGNATYDDLTADERNPPSPQVIQMGQSPVALLISATEFRDRPADAKSAASPSFCFWNTLSVGVEISTTGEVASFANGEGSFRGGGGGKLEPEDFARLQSLWDYLPDDRHRVPPATRRVIVEVLRGGSATVRVYDSADLPDAILEMLRITGARIQVVTPLLKPDRVLLPDEAGSLDLPAPRRPYDDISVSPDGSIGVLHDFVTKTLTVYQGSTWPEHGGMPVGGKILRVIPEFWQPPVYGGYSVNGEFSPDGRYFLVTWGKRIGAVLFDTASWKPVSDPQLFPRNLKEYLPAPEWDLGIAVTDAGEALVWDRQSHRVISKLPGLGELEDPPVITDKQGHRIYTAKNAEVQAAAFSPDGARVAIYSGPDNIFRMRLSLFDIRAGEKERDLWPVAWMSYPNGQPVWWNDGRWLVAPWSSRFSGGGTGVWNAETGRYLGALDLSGCNARGSPVADGTRLLQSCDMGQGQQDKVLNWSVDGMREQLKSAESLVSREQR